jgi:hypothetical protein
VGEGPQQTRRPMAQLRRERDGVVMTVCRGYAPLQWAVRI